MAVTLLLGVVVLAPSVQQFVAQRQRVAELEQSIAATQQQIDQLQAEKDRWTDPAYIEAQARGRLLFVRPGDTAYIVVDSDGAAQQAQDVPVSVEQHATESNWLDTFGESFLTAGTTTLPAAELGATAPTEGQQ